MSWGHDERRLRDLEGQCDYLQSEVDRYREADERRLRTEEQARRERRDAMLRAQCEADTWEEAYAKGIRRAREEGRQETQDIERYGKEAGEPFFGPWATALDRAQAIYCEETAAVRKEALARIALRVQMELPDGVDKERLAEALRDDDHSYLVNW